MRPSTSQKGISSARHQPGAQRCQLCPKRITPYVARLRCVPKSSRKINRAPCSVALFHIDSVQPHPLAVDELPLVLLGLQESRS